MALAIQKSRTPSAKSRLLSTLVMAFALMLQPMYGLVSAEVAGAVAATGTPEITDLRYATTTSPKTTYSGIVVDFGIKNFSDAIDCTIVIHRMDRTDATRTCGLDLLDHFNLTSDGVRKSTTVPFNVLGSSPSGWFAETTGYWGPTTLPVGLTVEIDTLSHGLVTASISTPLNQAYVPYADIAPVDNDGPVISQVSPDNNSYVGDKLSMKFNVQDPAGIKQVNIHLFQNGVTKKFVPLVDMGSGIWGVEDYDISDLSEGKYTFISRAQDNLGNTRVGTGTTHGSIIVDQTAPKININSFQGDKTLSAFREVSFGYYDANKVAYAVFNQGKPNEKTHNFTDSVWSNTDNVWSNRGWTGVTEGVNTVELYDVAGNKSSYSFTIDRGAPVISRFEFQNAKDGKFNPTKVVARATDAESFVTNVYMNVYKKDSNGDWKQQGGTFEQASPSGRDFAEMSASYALIKNEGTYKLEAWAKDAAGNVGVKTESSEFVVDNTAPYLAILNPINNREFLTTEDVVIETFTEDETVRVVMSIDGVAGTEQEDTTLGNGSLSSFFTITAGTLAVGDYTIIAKAYDAAGNETVSTRDFKVVAPETEAPSPEEPVESESGAPQPEDDGEEDDEDSETTQNQSVFPNPIFAFGNQDVLGEQDEAETSPVADSESEGVVAGDKDESGTPLTDTAVFGASSILGMAWYWWVAIVAALIGGWLAVAAAIRRNREEEA